MSRLAHFEIHADDVERAIGFYRALFGWKIERWGDQPYWLITTQPEGKGGTDGGILPRRGPRPSEGQPVNAFTCTMEVENLDAQLEKGQALDGKIALPKMAVPGIGWVAYMHDTEGNIFGMLQPDKDAK